MMYKVLCALFICYGVAAIQPFQVLQVQDIDGPGVGMYTQVRLPKDGTDLPIISYFDAECARLKSLRCTNEMCDTNNLINVVAGNCSSPLVTGRFETQMTGSDGMPFFAFANQFAIETAHCGDANCTSSLITKSIIHLFSADVNQTASYTTVAVGSNGMPLVGFYDIRIDSLRVAACSDLTCSSSTITIVNPNTGAYPCIAVGPDGIPVISYYNEDHASLEFVRCNDPLCQTEPFVYQTIDKSSSDVGRYTYVQIGSDKLPIMMYMDETNGFMKVAHCDSLNCTSYTTTVIDEVGISAYGEFPEMQINPVTGFAVLSYFNQTSHTSGALKVAQCADVACLTALVQIIQTGKCGYGRDSSLLFTQNGLVYVSFMDYSPFSRLRKVALAVLKQPISNIIDENLEYIGNSNKSYWSSTFQVGQANRTVFSIDDICQIIN